MEVVAVGANVNKMTCTNDHTVLSLACSNGHLDVVRLLLRSGADVTHKLKVTDKIRCVAMPSVMAVHCVGQNSGPTFHRLWTNVHRINSACARLSVVRLTISFCVLEILSIRSQSCPKF